MITVKLSSGGYIVESSLVSAIHEAHSRGETSVEIQGKKVVILECFRDKDTTYVVEVINDK